MVPVSINVADCCVCQRIDTIARKFNRLVAVLIGDCVIRFGGELKNVGGKPVFITASIGFRNGTFDPSVVEISLANVTRCVIRFAKIVSKRLRI
jgi:hypothetical protein